MDTSPPASAATNMIPAGTRKLAPGSSAGPVGGDGSPGVGPDRIPPEMVAASPGDNDATSTAIAAASVRPAAQSRSSHGVPWRQPTSPSPPGVARKTSTFAIGTTQSRPMAFQLKTPSWSTASRCSVYSIW